MDAYVYQAAMLCPACAEKTRNELLQGPFCSQDESDYWPQGPYCDGGGEADTPQHCDKCGVFLKNPLTRDGENYVIEAASEVSPHKRSVVDDWLDYYDYLPRKSA